MLLSWTKILKLEILWRFSSFIEQNWPTLEQIELKIYRHRQHWAQDTEQRKEKETKNHNTQNKTKKIGNMATTEKIKKKIKWKEAVLASHKTPAALLIIKSSKSLVSDRVHESSINVSNAIWVMDIP